MDEILTTVDLEKLTKALKKHRYEVLDEENGLALVSLHKKPRYLIVYLMFFFGVMRLFQQKVFSSLISFALGFLSIAILQYENKRYNLTYTEISKILVSEEHIQLDFKTDRPSIKFVPEQINSMTVSLSYDGKETMAAILLEDDSNVIHHLMTIMHKSEDAAKDLAEDVLQAIFEKLGVKEA